MNTKNIMWVAPLSLHDTSSGAAIQIKLFLEELAKRNFSCTVFGATTFESIQGSLAFTSKIENFNQLNNVWINLEENNVSYKYHKTKSILTDQMTRQEEVIFLTEFIIALNKNKPDIICLYGAFPLELAIINEAKKRNIKVCFNIFNPNYTYFDFSSVDLIFTDSQSTALHYKEKYNADLTVTNVFIDPNKVVFNGNMQRKYITFINPLPAKGVTLFMRLALIAQKRQPSWRFLVVESRARWTEVEQYFKLQSKDFYNVDKLAHSPDIRAVYALTKVLLLPSLWHESYGRVATEANLNGIPVLASNSGGIKEALNNGGTCLEVPQKCLEDFSYIPNDEEMEEWFSTLEKIMDDANYENYCIEAKKSSEAFNLQKNIDKAEQALLALFEE